ncbi:MAG: TRAP transporter substrate-binding protein DctP [Oscillospiraceae bacterium]|nr:TRAP transporter substrate-binding protein DctP [Oscillospiraceae bacterium]
MKRKHARRFLSLSIVLCMTAALLTGCGGTTSSSSDGGSTEAYTPDPDDYELIDVSYFDQSWSLDSDELGVFNLDLTSHEPATSMKTQFLEEWCRLIQDATDGGVNITIYPGGTLASASDALTAVETGSCDMAWFLGSNFSDVLPVTCMFYLPGIGLGDNITDCDIMWDLYEEYPAFEQEYTDNNLKLIHLYTCGSISINGVKITSLEDFQGLNIRTTGGYAADLMELLGASPISMGPGDLYDSMSKGVIDGYGLEWSGIKTFSLEEVTDYYNNDPLWVTVLGVIMNLDTYNSLPTEYQEVIDYYSGRDMSLQQAYNWDIENNEAQAELSTAEQNVSFDEEDYEELMEICRTYSEEQAEALTTDDFDAVAFLNDIYEEVAAHEDFVYYREAED